jgi:hypothetical protein
MDITRRDSGYKWSQVLGNRGDVRNVAKTARLSEFASEHSQVQAGDGDVEFDFATGVLYSAASHGNVESSGVCTAGCVSGRFWIHPATCGKRKRWLFGKIGVWFHVSLPSASTVRHEAT